jgi:hypothetical protein
MLAGAVTAAGCTSIPSATTTTPTSTTLPVVLVGDLSDIDIEYLGASIAHHEILVALGSEGVARGEDPAVKELAQRLVDLYGGYRDATLGLIETRGDAPGPADPADTSPPPVTVAVPPPTNLAVIAELSELGGRDFDKRLLDLVNDELRQLVTIATTEQGEGTDSDTMKLAGQSARVSLELSKEVALRAVELSKPPPTTIAPPALVPPVEG